MATLASLVPVPQLRLTSGRETEAVSAKCTMLGQEGVLGEATPCDRANQYQAWAARRFFTGVTPQIFKVVQPLPLPSVEAVLLV